MCVFVFERESRERERERERERSTKEETMDNFRRGLHSFFVAGPKMYQLY
jgi:hypothetical protein